MDFDVLALDSRGSPAWHQLQAETPQAVRARATALGLEVVSCRATGAWSGLIGGQIAGSRLLGTPRFALQVFCAQLIVLVRAGLGPVESLRILHANAQSDHRRQVIARLLASLDEGIAFSEALSQDPASFPPLFVAVVRASERTSGLAQALTRYLAHLAQVDALRVKLRAAAMYPVFLCAIGGLVILFLMGYVVPRFSSAYESIHTPLPLAAQWMLAWGQFVRGHTPTLQLTVGVGLISLALLVMTPPVRKHLSGLTLRVAIIGGWVRRVHLARLYRTLAMLLDGGIALTPAIRICRPMLPDGFQRAADHVVSALAEGRRVSDAFSSAGLTTPVSLNLMVVGERSGQLATLLDESAAFLEQEYGQAIDAAMRIVEPVLMALMGLVIGGIVILMYLPIFELAGSLQ